MLYFVHVKYISLFKVSTCLGGIYGAEEDEDPERLPFTIVITSRNMKYKLGTTQLDYIYIMLIMVQNINPFSLERATTCIDESLESACRCRLT